MDFQVEDKKYLPHVTENSCLNIFGETKVTFVMLLMSIIFIYVIVFFVLGKKSTMSGGSTQGTSSSNMMIFALEILLWIVLIYVIYINLHKYNNNNYDFQSRMVNLFDSRLSELNVDSSLNDNANQECKKEDNGKEVFHISNNKFTFEEARDICETYGARLATYDEIEDSYNNGASWCSYGWSQGKLALFPTQKALYNELKTIPGHENDCGRPGINGGYFKNKLQKFGANCYGVKPKPTQKDKDYTHAMNHFPQNADGKDLKSIYDKYIIAPFNKDKWTMTKSPNVEIPSIETSKAK